jgi:hypothetical protein
MKTTTTKKQPHPSGYDRSGQLMMEIWPFPAAVETACPECGAPAVNGRSCRELYEELLELETSDPTGAGSVHNLSVLCYVLQHPRDYSDAALSWGVSSLRECLDNGHSRKKPQPQSRGLFNSLFLRALFRHKPKATPASRPALPSRWRMTIDQVYLPHPQGHPERVQQWARAILADITP